LVRRARGRPERLGADVLALGAGYRAAAADLALARRRFPGDPVVASLEQLVAEARSLVYLRDGRRPGLRAFFGRGYWALVVARRRALLLAVCLLFVPLVLGALWGHDDPAAAIRAVPSAAAGLGADERGSLGLGADEQAAFASQISTNNIQVTFLAFAGGILLGLPAAFVLVSNGFNVGALGGVAASAGNGGRFIELVAAHGVLELSCIVVAGAAGLRLGWAVVRPGHRARTTSATEEGRATVAIVLGTAPWLVVAGVLEGFVTPRGVGAGPALAIGVLAAAPFWALVATRGRSTPGGSVDQGVPVARPDRAASGEQGDQARARRFASR
jgi:uncharacterized membrane protein SpoIIM required for sporulation